MIEIFETLTNLIENNGWPGVFFSFIWGILSILLSPCHLASIPLVIAFVNQQGEKTISKAFYISLSFAIGILLTIVAIGLITAAMGQVVGDIGTLPNYIIAAVFILIGLYLMDVFDLPWQGLSNLKTKKTGLLGAFILGTIFGLAVGPCSFAFMAPMLGVVFTSAATNILQSILIIIAYAFGHCLLIIFAGTSTQIVQSYMDFNEKTKIALILRKTCGVLILTWGLYMLYKT